MLAFDFRLRVEIEKSVNLVTLVDSYWHVVWEKERSSFRKQSDECAINGRVTCILFQFVDISGLMAKYFALPLGSMACRVARETRACVSACINLSGNDIYSNNDANWCKIPFFLAFFLVIVIIYNDTCVFQLKNSTWIIRLCISLCKTYNYTKNSLNFSF